MKRYLVQLTATGSLTFISVGCGVDHIEKDNSRQEEATRQDAVMPDMEAKAPCSAADGEGQDQDVDSFLDQLAQQGRYTQCLVISGLDDSLGNGDAVKP